MGLFDRLRRRPRWARVFTDQAHFERWLSWLHTSLARRGLVVPPDTLRAGALLVEVNGQSLALPLAEHAGRFARRPDSAWEGVLDAVFHAALRPVATAEGPPWVDAARLLRTEVFCGERFEVAALLEGFGQPNAASQVVRSRRALVTADVAPGLVGVLRYARPHGRVDVPPSEAAAWNKAPSDLVALGLKRAREEAPVQVTARSQDGVTLYAATGPESVVPAWALDLSAPRGKRWPGGVLLALPSRGEALYHPVTGPAAAGALRALARLTEQTHRDGPGGGFGPRLWWRRDTHPWVQIPLRIEGDPQAPVVVPRVPEAVAQALREVCE